MDAIRTPRTIIAFLGFAFSSINSAQAQSMTPISRGSSVVRTENFIVSCSDPAFAQQVAKAAEEQRRDLAIHWLGKPLPQWSQACPITVVASPRLGAGGSTTYQLSPGRIGGWIMEVKGSQERILDSVLPHEISHTILATYFTKLGKPVPRWADEGACTTVEHASERDKHDQFLIQFLSQGRGLPFATMFTLKEYPRDIMPLYAQGYSVTSFLIAQGGPRRFVDFLEDGMTTENWMMATERHYGYPMIGKLQTAWNKWVSDGGGNVERHTAVALGLSRDLPAANPRSAGERVVMASSTQPNETRSQPLATNENPWVKQALATSEALVAQNGSAPDVISIGRAPLNIDSTMLASNQVPFNRNSTTELGNRNDSSLSWYRQQLARTTQKEQLPLIESQAAPNAVPSFSQSQQVPSNSVPNSVPWTSPPALYSEHARLIR
jgi:hypothetical protein